MATEERRNAEDLERQPEGEAKPDAELGILLVHGIGQQTRGQTLVDYGDPLCRFIERWVKGSVGAQELSKKIGLSSTQANLYSNVKTHGAVLTSSEDGTPPHFFMDFSGPGDPEPKPEPKRWIVAEAFWADSFPRPDPNPVTIWLMKVSPYIWMSFFARHLFMSFQSVRKTWQSGHLRGWAELLTQIIVISFWAVVTVALSPGVLLLEMTLIFLLVVAVIPLPPIHNLIGQAQAKISAILGDSYIVASSPVRRAAVAKQVASAVQWLERRSKNVVILGHSQGAALSYETLRDRPSEKTHLLLTFGSGLQKLHQLEKSGFEVGFSSCLSIMAVLYCCVPLAEVLGIIPVRSWEWWLVAFTFLMAMSLLALSVGFVIVTDEVTEIRDWAKKFSRRGAHWVDIFASADPVPNGPLFLGPESSVESIEVRNERSVLRDHTAYRNNLDEFYAHLIRIIGEYSGTQIPLGRLTPLDGLALDRARRLRQARSFSKQLDTYVLFISLIMVLANPQLLVSWGSKIANFANERVCNVLNSRYQGILSRDCWTILPMRSGVLLALLGWIALGFLVEFVFDLRATLEEKSLYGRRAPASSTEVGIAYSSAAHTVSCVSLVLALQKYVPHVDDWIKGIPIHPGHPLFQGFLVGYVLAILLFLLELFKVHQIVKTLANTLQKT